MAGIRERLPLLITVCTKIMELPMDYCLCLLISLTSWLAPLDWLIRLFKFKFWVTATISSIHQYCTSLSLGLPKMSPGRDSYILGNICSIDKTHSSTWNCLLSFIYHFMGCSSVLYLYWNIGTNLLSYINRSFSPVITAVAINGYLGQSEDSTRLYDTCP